MSVFLIYFTRSDRIVLIDLLKWLVVLQFPVVQLVLVDV